MVFVAKHLRSSVYDYLADMKQIRELPEFKRSFENSKNKEKLVMIVTVDGGPDERLGMKKNVHVRFNTYDLDVFFLLKNASGRSAFNRVERRKAPLNIELGGVLLEHEHFGVHLDDKGDTIDPYLELKKLGTCRKDFR